MKAGEMRDLTKEELKEKEGELDQELFNLRFQKATSQLGNTSLIKEKRKDLARIKTVLREMEISGEKGAQNG